MFSFKRHIETDDEFVCKIRKRIKNIRKVAIFQLVFALVLMAVGLLLLFLIFHSVYYTTHKMKLAWIGLSVGIIMGMLFAFAMEMAISNFVDAVSNFKGRREYNLLIKYYDALTNPSQRKTDNTE